MAVRIESRAEPIPGYRLIERLGGGGFGEVWKCEAPGGLFKAIKFVYGDLESTDEEGARAEQELKALSRVKTVHHPYILSLERYDIIDGQLLIVMELADRTLWDRFRECRSQGLPGIPRPELIGYMDETAEALDLMDSLHQLQHLDIKPQNLFLTHNHVKVADFGLVKDLEGGMASMTGGVTPVYAAPETFDGKVTRFSDQYSLAIVYQELLTGERPFTGTSLRQLVMQHLYNEPELSPLPPADRGPVGRALAKISDQRFPTCKDFVGALHEAGATPTPPSTALPSPEALTPATATYRGKDVDDGQKTHGGPKQRQGLRPAPPPLPDPDPASPAAERVTPSPIRELSTAAPAPQREECTTPLPAVPRKGAGEGRDGVLVPALVIGLGRLGLCVLRQLRQQIHDRFSSADVLPQVRFLYLDTDPEATNTACRGRPDAALRAGEVLVARLQRPSHYLKGKESGSGIETWLHPKTLYRMPRQQTPCGIRALGRLAFVDNHRTVVRRLEAELGACSRPEALEQAAKDTGLAAGPAVPRVYVVASLAGGTGGGMFLDVAYAARQLLRAQGHDRAEVVGVLLLPSGEADAGRTAELANACAALTELNHYGEPGAVFQARYESGESGPPLHFSEAGPPFGRCLLFSLPDPRGGVAVETPDGGPAVTPATARVLALVGQALFTELTSPLGRAADLARERQRTVGGARPLYTAAGSYRLVWPRRQMLEQSSRAVCRRLVQRWLSKDAKPLRDGLRGWVQAQWDHFGLSQETLIGRFQQGCQKELKQAPESAFAAIGAAIQAAAPPAGKAGAPEMPPLSAVCEAMERLEQLLGVPEECRKGTRPEPGSTSRPPGQVEQALTATATALREEYDQKLAELVVRLIEDPRSRLAGAEEALRQLTGHVEQALRNHEDLARELTQRAIDAYQRIQEVLESPEASSPAGGWKTPFTRRPASVPPAAAARLLELLRAYPKYRYQSLVLQHVSGLYLALRGQLSDQLREVDFLRARLGELLEMFRPPEAAAQRAGGAVRHLLPAGCRTVEEAVAQIDEGVTPDRLLDLDQKVQVVLRKQFRALVQVCMTSTSVLKTLAPAMLQEARAFLEPALASADVAEQYLEQFAETAEGSATEALQRDLKEVHAKAAPELRGLASPNELFILSVPPGSGGKEFRELARQALGVPRLTDALSPDEIIFYREYQLSSLAELEPLGPAAQEAYQKVLAQEYLTPHTRIDVAAWRPAVAAR